MPKVRPNGGIIRVKKDRNPIKPILSNLALNSEQVCNQRRYTVVQDSSMVDTPGYFFSLVSSLFGLRAISFRKK